MDRTTESRLHMTWESYVSNLKKFINRLLQLESLANVTIACDGETFQAHQIVLSASSEYFENIFAKNSHPHPIIFMKGVKSSEMRALLNFMYTGNLDILRSELNELWKTAESLKILGFMETCEEYSRMPCISSDESARFTASDKRLRMGPSSEDASGGYKEEHLALQETVTDSDVMHPHVSPFKSHHLQSHMDRDLVWYEDTKPDMAFTPQPASSQSIPIVNHHLSTLHESPKTSTVQYDTEVSTRLDHMTNNTPATDAFTIKYENEHTTWLGESEYKQDTGIQKGYCTTNAQGLQGSLSDDMNESWSDSDQQESTNHDGTEQPLRPARGSMFETLPGNLRLKKSKICGKIVKGYKHRYVHYPGDYKCMYAFPLFSR